jgi:alkaline phosphatase D
MKRLFSLFIAVLFSITITAQTLPSEIISGPMHGNVDMRSAQVWAELKPASNLNLVYWDKLKPAERKMAMVAYSDFMGFRTAKFTLVALEPGNTYQYSLTTGTGKSGKLAMDGEITTRDNWMYRKTLPDFSFLTGSCNYVNEPQYDRVYTDFINPEKIATPYGGDSSIFETMAKTPANFMLWLGDNWYTREVDYNSEWGLNYRASHDRATPVLQNFLKAMPHYAIWDDHDFGPNDCDKGYHLKDASRQVFMNYWLNPSYGESGKGIYSRFVYADAEFFLLDDRTFRSSDNMADSINNFPNSEKKMFGPEQMDWLKNGLLGSKANFKIIVTGSQVLNPVSPFDCFRKFPVEYNELLGFLNIEKISGVLFFTGDRHHSEVIKVTRTGTYPLYDITCSPLTSGTHKFGRQEAKNPYRVLGIDEKQNFGKVSFTGEPENRKMTVEFLGINGDKLGEWSVLAQQLRVPRVQN